MLLLVHRKCVLQSFMGSASTSPRYFPPEVEDAVCKTESKAQFLVHFLANPATLYPVLSTSIYTAPTSQQVIHSTPVVTQAGQVPCLVPDGAWGLKVSELVTQFLIPGH